MPKFRVPITRDVTVTAAIRVEATDSEHAVALAERYARMHPQNLNYELDDCMGGEPYFAGGDDYAAVDEL